MDQGEIKLQEVGDGRDTLGAAGVGRHNNTLAPVGDRVLNVLDYGGLGKEIVNRDVKKALDLRGMEVHGDDVVRASHSQHVGDQLGRDGRAALVLLVLAGVEVVGDDRRDLVHRGDLACVDENQQLHQDFVDVARATADDKHILPAHRRLNLNPAAAQPGMSTTARTGVLMVEIVG